MFKNLKAKLKRWKFSFDFQIMLIKQAMYAKENFIDYITMNLMTYKILDQPSEFEKFIVEEADRMAKELDVNIGVAFLDEEQMKQRMQMKGISSNLKLTMETIPREFTPELDQSMDHLLVYPDAIAKLWKYADFQREHKASDVIRSMLKHEFRHLEQIKKFRELGIDVTEVYLRKDMSPFGYFADITEYDAYQFQLGKERSIDEFIEEYQNEYGAA